MEKLTSKVSSNTFLSFFFFWMPFSLANFSHLVIAFGPGTFRDLGRDVVGAGKTATIESSTRSVGRVHISFIKSWRLSLVISFR